ncbi:MAG: glutaredoxin family protein [Chromatiaceae bacterium]|nr:glutaredoxin family protein [Chromatiaceae bacterium]
MATPPPVFYFRDGCHLCEELAAVLFRGWPEQAAVMEWRDVDARPEWRRMHGASVPVLMAGDQVVCALLPDLARIEQYFGPMANPV